MDRKKAFEFLKKSNRFDIVDSSEKIDIFKAGASLRSFNLTLDDEKIVWGIVREEFSKEELGRFCQYHLTCIGTCFYSDIEEGDDGFLVLKREEEKKPMDNQIEMFPEKEKEIL